MIMLSFLSKLTLVRLSLPSVQSNNKNSAVACGVHTQIWNTEGALLGQALSGECVIKHAKQIIYEYNTRLHHMSSFRLLKRLCTHKNLHIQTHTHTHFICTAGSVLSLSPFSSPALHPSNFLLFSFAPFYFLLLLIFLSSSIYPPLISTSACPFQLSSLAASG